MPRVLRLAAICALGILCHPTMAQDVTRAAGANKVSKTGDTMTGPLTINTATAPALSITGIASGAAAINVNAGSRITWNSELAAGFYRYSTNTLAIDGSLIAGGAFTTGTYFGATSSPAELRGGAADGAAAVGTILNTSPVFATAGSKLVSIRNNSVEKASIGYAGDLTLSGNLTAGSAGSSMTITSATSAATATATVPALLLKPSVALDLNDLVFQVTPSNGTTNLLSVDNEGDFVAGGRLTFTGTTLPQISSTSDWTMILRNGGITAATATPSIAAFRFDVSNALDATDLLFDVENDTASVFSINKQGDVTAKGQLVLPLTSAVQITSTGDVPLKFTSGITAATATSGTAAFRFTPTNALDPTDLVFDVENGYGASLLTVDHTGLTTVPGVVHTSTRFETDATTSNNLLCTGTFATCTVKSSLTGTANTWEAHNQVLAGGTVESFDRLLDLGTTAGSPKASVTGDGEFWNPWYGKVHRTGELVVVTTADTAFTALGLPSPTVTGTPSSDPTIDPTRNMITYASGALSGNTGGLNGPYTSTRFSYGPRAYVHFHTGANITAIRYWIGLSSANLAGGNHEGADGNVFAALRDGPGDGAWQACTGDGTTGSCTASTAPPLNSTDYSISIDCSTGTVCQFNLNRGSVRYSVTKTTNIPTSSTTSVGLIALVETTEAVAKYISVARAGIVQN